jgi:hypothetical protein
MIKWREYYVAQLISGRPISEIKQWRREWEIIEIKRWLKWLK